MYMIYEMDELNHRRLLMDTGGFSRDYCPTVGKVYGLKLNAFVTQVPLWLRFEHKMIVTRSLCPLGS